MSHVHPLLPRLTVNRQFMSDLIAAETPCFALGLVEERKRQRGFLALRPDREIPPDVSNGGFRFGHSLLGNAEFEVVHFAFDFYGFETYNVLVNPNNPLVQTVLTMMVESADYFFFALGANDSATAFRSDIGHGALASPTQPILNFAIVHRPRLGPAGRGSAGLIPLELCRDMRARLPIESAYRSVA